LVKDENDDLPADSQNILNKWKNYSCQILKVHGVNNVRQTEIHTAEPLGHELRSFDVEITTEKSPGTDHIPGGFIQEGDETYILRSTNSLVSIWSKEELSKQWKSLLLYLFIRRVTKLTSNCKGISLLSTSYKILSNILLSRLTPNVDKITGDHLYGFWCKRTITDQIFCIHKILERMGV
jgi:hypothetical protein